jgi:hypothetical protein
MALVIVTWQWGSKYDPSYAERLRAGVARHLKQDHRFLVIVQTFREDQYLTEIRGCFARLRMFDPAWQAHQGIAEGDRLVCMDLDMIITGPLDPLFDRPEPFVILQKVNAANPCPFNGSLWMLRGGYRPDVWRDFSIEAAAGISFHEFPDDQAWLAGKIPDAGAWTGEHGVYAFGKRGWPGGDNLPANAAVVAFPGYRDPSQFTHLPWVKKHWRA